MEESSVTILGSCFKTTTINLWLQWFISLSLYSKVQHALIPFPNLSQASPYFVIKWKSRILTFELYSCRWGFLSAVLLVWMFSIWRTLKEMSYLSTLNCWITSIDTPIQKGGKRVTQSSNWSIAILKSSWVLVSRSLTRVYFLFPKSSFLRLLLLLSDSWLFPYLILSFPWNMICTSNEKLLLHKKVPQNLVS